MVGFGVVFKGGVINRVFGCYNRLFPEVLGLCKVEGAFRVWILLF